MFKLLSQQTVTYPRNPLESSVGQVLVSDEVCLGVVVVVDWAA